MLPSKPIDITEKRQEDRYQKERFARLLKQAVAFHGHLCSGLILGIRMAILGLDGVEIRDPYGADRKKLIVFVEVARCFADALMSVTGCRAGKRSFKLIDTGKIAATFYHMQTEKAIRIAARPEILPLAEASNPHLSPHEAEKKFYLERPANELFIATPVNIVPLREEDTPGIPATTVCCTRCGERIYDRRHLIQAGQPLCPTCAEKIGLYYQTINETKPSSLIAQQGKRS